MNDAMTYQGVVVVVTSGSGPMDMAVSIVGSGPIDIAVSIVGAGVVFASHESSSDTSGL